MGRLRGFDVTRTATYRGPSSLVVGVHHFLFGGFNGQDNENALCGGAGWPAIGPPVHSAARVSHGHFAASSQIGNGMVD
jgi:hypothetical protein